MYPKSWTISQDYFGSKKIDSSLDSFMRDLSTQYSKIIIKNQSNNLIFNKICIKKYVGWDWVKIKNQDRTNVKV